MKPDPKNLKASLLDRLVDHDPGISHEPVRFRFVSISQIKASVARDLENLLNTKRRILLPPAACREVSNSLFVYGLRDFTSQNPRSPSVRQQLRRDIEKTVTRFEPRLKNMKVEMEKNRADQHSIYFRITGLLVVEPIRESVVFDTYFDVNRGKYVVSK